MKTTLRNVLVAALAGVLFAPAASAQNFNALPKSGKATFDAWPGYFWSYFGGKPSGIAGGLAYRYADNVSPAELFDKAFGNGTKLAAALPKIQAFGECALKAKQACMPASGANRMNTECLKKSEIRSAHAACKKDFGMDTVTAHEVVNQGVGKLDADFWWGICHGWAAAAVLFKEPVKNVVHNGVTFRPGDIKGFLSVAGTDIDLAPGGWVGTRYDGPSSGDAALQDVTPRQYHNFMAKFLGAGKGVVVDRYTGAEVWNQPTDRFETTCAAGGAGCAAGEQAQTCRTAFTWAEDHNVTDLGNGNRTSSAYTTRNLNYTVCVKDGLITGEGKWNHDPNADKNALHPDFIWAPGSLRDGSGASNPMIAMKSAEIISKLANPSAGVGSSTGGTTTPTLPEKKVAVTVNKAIPDNSATGVTATATVAGTGKIKTYATCLNITHTYRGDILCTATYGGKTANVWNKEGGSTDNINTCISHTSFNGLAAGGAATVKCSDVGKGDIGKWVGLEVRYTVQ